VTSRAELRGLIALDGASPVHLDVLPPVESHALLGRMIGTDRVEYERAATTELAELCRHLALALRMAGAHLVSHPAKPLDAYVRNLAQGDHIGKLAIPEDARAAARTAFD
jgi:hypothetical protein